MTVHYLFSRGSITGYLTVTRADDRARNIGKIIRISRIFSLDRRTLGVKDMIIKLRSQGACASVVIGALLGACIYYVARKSGIGKKSFSLPRYFKKEKPKFSFNEPKVKT